MYAVMARAWQRKRVRESARMLHCVIHRRQSVLTGSKSTLRRRPCLAPSTFETMATDRERPRRDSCCHVTFRSGYWAPQTRLFYSFICLLILKRGTKHGVQEVKGSRVLTGRLSAIIDVFSSGSLACSAYATH